MDYENNENMGREQGQNSSTSNRKKGRGWRFFWGIVISFSVLANVILLVMLFAVVVFFSAGKQDGYTQEVIKTGSNMNKIAVLNIQGIITDDLAKEFKKQLKAVKKGDSIKALIIRVNTPGGAVSASDTIYHEIVKYRKSTGKPVVAFMNSVAASGGYYSSVACDKIIAQPTTITGSIGVVMNYMVVQDLLNEKLGIVPVTVKSAKKKSWPSAFEPPNDEVIDYLQRKLIKPTYQRFVEVVDEGREQLSLEEVKKLADGSIYNAAEAVELKLIDKTGYMEDAIELAASLAKIKNPQVIEYRKPFSLSNLLTANSQANFKLDRSTIHEMTKLEVMYLWSPLY